MAYAGIIVFFLVGFVFVGYNYAANTDSWGMFADAHLALYIGILLIVLGLMGIFFKFLKKW